MSLIDTSVRQPITVAVGVILACVAGLIAFTRVPIAMTPEVEDTVIAVTTTWENASPQEIESEIVDEQEERLQGVQGLRGMTSTSRAGVGTIRLEFVTGIDKSEALREVSDKIREVPSYPEGVDEPVIEDSDPESRDYVAWIVLITDDPDYDVTELRDWMERAVVPTFERIPGVSEVGVLGGREREFQIRLDPQRLANRGITTSEFADAIRATNDNFSGGALREGKADVRVRTLGRFSDREQVLNTVIRQDEAGPVYVRDVADVAMSFKEATDFARARGRQSIAINFQRELGSNVMEVVGGIRSEMARLNADGGLLDVKARQLGLDGRLELAMTYNQTSYIEQAISLVQGNIVVGGAIAVVTLLLFLRSVRSVGIIGIAIPISVVGSVVVLVALGRTVNIISLAGIAFAVGMVVDNSIVVLENIFRHLEMGKNPAQAAVDGTKEVAGAVLASTLTTLVVFLPILLIQESAGQLFRDIALAICAAVGLSYIVAITVIPSASALLLRERVARRVKYGSRLSRLTVKARRGAMKVDTIKASWWLLIRPIRLYQALPRMISGLVWRLSGRVPVKIGVVGAFVAATLIGTALLVPPLDYLPRGNRNIIFSILIPPPGYSHPQLDEIGTRLESTMRPLWLAAGPSYRVEEDDAEFADPAGIVKPAFPISPEPGSPRIQPPALEQYFVVSMNGVVFHAGIAEQEDGERVIDLIPAFQAAGAPDIVPGVHSFAFQLPLFRVGGTTGSAVKIDLSGPDLDRVASAAGALFGRLAEEFGPYATQPDPPNFNVPSPELQVEPDLVAMSDLGLTVADLGIAMQAAGDGAIIGDYDAGDELIDLKIINADQVGQTTLYGVEDVPLATPYGTVVPVSSVAELVRRAEPEQIRRVGRQRAVTLQFTPPEGMPLGEAIDRVDAMIADLKRDADPLTGEPYITPDVQARLAGSASKLDEIREALLGDGSLVGTLSSSLFLALLVVYLLMCVLFQSWSYPMVIMVSVPLATFGGFLALAGVNAWSVADRYMPDQNMDVLTILGFVILAGVVVNNAILLVDQTLLILRGKTDTVHCPETSPDSGEGHPVPPRCAIAMAVESRVRPILMSTLTSVGGMLPLVLAPGSGSELYRGLGAVVLGGLVVSTVFTMLLVPLLLSLVFDAQAALAKLARRVPSGAGLPAAATASPDA